MSRDIANLVAFGLTIAAGVICIALGHESIGGSLLLGSAFHAAPSAMESFRKMGRTTSTPGLERAEQDEQDAAQEGQ